MSQIEILVTMTLIPLLPHNSSQLHPGTSSPAPRSCLHTPGSAAFPCPLPPWSKHYLFQHPPGPLHCKFSCFPQGLAASLCPFGFYDVRTFPQVGVLLVPPCHLWLHCSLSLHCLNLPRESSLTTFPPWISFLSWTQRLFLKT